ALPATTVGPTSWLVVMLAVAVAIVGVLQCRLDAPRPDRGPRGRWGQPPSPRCVSRCVWLERWPRRSPANGTPVVVAILPPFTHMRARCHDCGGPLSDPRPLRSRVPASGQRRFPADFVLTTTRALRRCQRR